MTFSTTNLVDHKVVVRGTDAFGTSGTVVLDGEQWAEVNAHTEYDQAVEAFEAAVEEFFAPLAEASDKLDKALERPTDSLGYVVLTEKVEATEGTAEVLIKLTKDSQILRLIEQGDTDRLMWVGDSLEITAVVSDTEAIDRLKAELGATEV